MRMLEDVDHIRISDGCFEEAIVFCQIIVIIWSLKRLNPVLSRHIANAQLI